MHRDAVGAIIDKAARLDLSPEPASRLRHGFVQAGVDRTALRLYTWALFHVCLAQSSRAAAAAEDA